MDLGSAIAGWLDTLSRERRAAANTVEAYARDLRQFASACPELRTTQDFLARKPSDLRAFLAARREEGVGNRTLMRQIAGLRSFARHLEREGHGHASAFLALRGPRLKRRLPRPLAPEDARALARPETREGEARPAWILARDAAALGLLYGAGLRISEALSLRRGQAPRPGEVLTILGKGGKARHVPILPAIAAGIADYLAQCPWTLPAEGPLFVGARGGPLSPRLLQLAM